MARMSFDSVFVRHADGSVEPRRRVQIGGIGMEPGVRFARGVSFSGVDWAAYAGHDLEVEAQGDILVIKAIDTRSPLLTIRGV